jgi:tetratricopeptide (TPR) repeat protein
MADPHSSDANRAGASPVDPEDDAKIDELLLTGLEHYFAGRFQEAINVWGRVLFLNRGHARARAYIERARSAQAERQRHSEELVHEGVAAIQRGDGGTARELLESAAAQGENPELALAYLDRLEHLAGGLGTTNGAPDVPARSRREPRSRVPRAFLDGGQRPVRVLPLVIIAVCVLAIILFAASNDLLKPLVDSPWRHPAAGRTVSVDPEPLPLPRTADLLLARARSLSSSGHLRDALGVLDRIPSADPVFADAERLRAEIQRSLLDASGLSVDAPSPAEREAREP